MKETLAAALLMVADWPAIAAAGGGFVDPMCGSGTLPIEAALIAGDIAPGLTRESWGFSRWLGHDAEAWDALVAEAVSRREAGLRRLPADRGFRLRPREPSRSRASCVARAGLDGFVEIAQRELAELIAPDPSAGESAPGLVAVNPPYGERLEARGGLGALYRELSDRLRSGFDGWTLAVITPDEYLEAGLGLSAEKTAPLYNGRILTQARVFRVPGAGVAGRGAGRRGAAGAGSATRRVTSRTACARTFGTWRSGRAART